MKTVFKESEIPKEAREEYERIENKFLEEEFHTKEKEFKSIKQTEKEAEELGKRSWVTLDLKTAKKDWFKLHERIRTLKSVVKLLEDDLKKAKIWQRTHKEDKSWNEIINLYKNLIKKIEG